MTRSAPPVKDDMLKLSLRKSKLSPHGHPVYHDILALWICGASACSVAAPAVTTAFGAINATQVMLGEIVRESAERGSRANDQAAVHNIAYGFE